MEGKMKQWMAGILTVILGVVSIPHVMAANLSRDDLSVEVRETLERELGNFRLRDIRKSTEDGKTVFQISATGRQSVRLNMIIDEHGNLLDKVNQVQLRVVDNQLKRERGNFWIQSLYTPEAGDPEQAPGALIESLSTVCYAGGNILVFDLHGLTPDGKELTEAAKEFYQQAIDRLLYIKLNSICRIFNSNSPQDPAYRMNAVRTVADYFKDENHMIFVIDGPNAAELAQEFKKLAPDLTVAAPGADLAITDSEPVAADPLTIALRNSLPDRNSGRQHFILRNTPENLKALDERNSSSEEMQSWIPDNSILAQEEREEGFVALFDGKTKNGWLPSAPNQGFIVKDGELQCQPGRGSIRTVKRFDDFILRFDYKIEDRGNSGAQVRAPRSSRASKIGFEVQIFGDYGDKPSKDGTGAIYNVLAPTENASRPAGEWNSMEITCNGPHVRVILNGKTVQDINLDEYEELKYRLRDGFIILTDHGADVSYRNIRIREL
jgi:hypothetical protein